MTKITEYKEVPIASIDVQEGYNPRQRIDIDPGFLRSIRESGITTPLEVRTNGGPNSYVLISGHRRLAHAQEAGLKTVPVLVKLIEGGSEQEFLHTLIENVQREDLTPLEEAQALKRLQELGVTSRKALVAKTGLSEAVVKARLTLLDLPEELALWISEGDIPYAAVDHLLPWAQQCPQMALQIGQVIRDEKATATDVNRWFGRYVDSAVLDLADHDEEMVLAWTEYAVYELSEFDLPPVDRDLVTTINEQLHPRSLAFGISKDTLEQGRASGFVIDVPSDIASDEQVWITSLPWMVEVFSAHLNSKKFKDSLNETLSKKAEGKPIDSKDLPSKDTRSYEERQAEQDEERKSQRADEREQAKVDKAAAEVHNTELAKQVFERVSIDKVDPKAIDALITLAIEGHGVEWAMRGLRYIHPGWTEEETTEAGNTRTVLVGPSGDKAKIKLDEFLSAPTVEGKLTKFAQLYLAAYTADEKIVARTNRSGFAPCAPNVVNGGTKLGAFYKQLIGKLTPTLRKNAQAQFDLERSKTMRSPFDDREFTASAGSALGVSDTDD